MKDGKNGVAAGAVGKRGKKKIGGSLELWSMTVPGLLVILLVGYIPMFGIVLAFKKFGYNTGFNSPWCGLENFKFLFNTPIAGIMIRNTILYNILFIAIEIITGVAVAIALFEIRSKKLIKYYQTTMLLPHFISWVIVGYIAYIFLAPGKAGLINQMLGAFGQSPVDWYNEAGAWPLVLTLSRTWKGIGMQCIMYYAVLMGMDMEVIEAARIDGANKWQQTIHIVIPTLVPTMIILAILAIGNIFRGDVGLFYQVPRLPRVSLQSTTEVIDTYMYSNIANPEGKGAVAATSFLQSVVGFIMVVTANGIVKKIDPDRAMF